MNFMKTFFFLYAIYLLAGCAAKHGYNKTVDFSNLKTFEWLSLTADPDITEATKDFVKNEINQKLIEKGLTPTPDTPDFLVSAHIGKDIKLKASDFWVKLTPNQLEKIQYVEGSLSLVFKDSKSKEMIWWGSVQAKLSKNYPQKKKEKIAGKAIAEVLDKYPRVP